MQLPLLVPPVDLEIHPGQVPIGEHVDEAILPLWCIADFWSILIRGGNSDLEVRQDVGEVGGATARDAILPRRDDLGGRGPGGVDGQAGGGEDDRLHGAPDCDVLVSWVREML